MASKMLSMHSQRVLVALQVPSSTKASCAFRDRALDAGSARLNLHLSRTVCDADSTRHLLCFMMLIKLELLSRVLKTHSEVQVKTL